METHWLESLVGRLRRPSQQSRRAHSLFGSTSSSGILRLTCQTENLENRILLAANVGDALAQPAVGQDSEVEDVKIAGGSNIASGVFGDQRVVDNSSAANSAAVADLDGDGDSDVVVGRSSIDTGLRWYENDGSGRFSQHLISTGTLSRYDVVSVGDLDGDGDVDILSASSLSNGTVQWHENNEGTFITRPISDAALLQPRSISAADVDGDGDLDVLVGSSNGVVWYENDGNRVFSTNLVPSTSGATSTAAADIDRDGDTDLVVAGSRYGVAWLENDGTQRFIKHSVNVGTDHVALGDMNGDGHIDIVGTKRSGSARLQIYTNDGSGVFSQKWMSTSTPTFTSLADIDGDGDTDVLLSTSDGVTVYDNDGLGTLSARKVLDGSLVAEGDLDGDGDLDLIGNHDVSGTRSFVWNEQLDLQSEVIVTTLDDVVDAQDGVVSLREAVSRANVLPGDQAIRFSQSLFAGGPSEILLSEGQIELSDTSGITRLQGPGAALLGISGRDLSRVFLVNPEVTAEISGLRISDGLASFGGGIANQGTLALTNVIVSDNTAVSASSSGAMGGGISNSGVLFLDKVLLSGNQATAESARFLDGGDGRRGSSRYPLSGGRGGEGRDGRRGIGGAVANLSSGSATISESAFIANEAAGGLGGTGGTGGEGGGTAYVAGNGGAGGRGGVGGIGRGGAIYSEGTLTASDNLLLANVATGGHGNVGGKGGNGGYGGSRGGNGGHGGTGGGGGNAEWSGIAAVGDTTSISGNVNLNIQPVPGRGGMGGQGGLGRRGSASGLDGSAGSAGTVLNGDGAGSNLAPYLAAVFRLDVWPELDTTAAAVSTATTPQSVSFMTIFSESVSRVDPDDFVVNGGTTASVTDAVPVSGSSFSQFRVVVTGGDLSSFNGQIGIELSDSQDIVDSESAPLQNRSPQINERLLRQGQMAAEVAVTGLSSTNISDGDNFPSTIDGTDFGSVTQGSTVSRTFTVRNSGNATLTNSSLSVPNGYSITDGLTGSIAPGESDTFTATLDASSIGTYFGFITFNTNDSDESTFDFAVTATVESAASAHVDLAGGVLTITGSPSDDQVTVSETDSLVTVDANGVSSEFDSANVDRIRFMGEAGDDSFVNRTKLPAVLDGGAGHDSLQGGSGRDTLRGGSGDDLLIGHQGRDWIDGEAGNDTALGAAHDDTLIGGNGVDFLDGQGSSHDVLIVNASEGADDISVQQSGAYTTVRERAASQFSSNFRRTEHVTLNTLGGDDSVVATDITEAGYFRLRARLGDGNDSLDFSSSANSEMILIGIGSAGQDTLAGGPGRDRLNGGTGSSTLSGNQGNDTLVGGESADQLDGGDGEDRLRAFGGNDTLIGGGARDWLYGGDGDDALDGGDGRDRLQGQAGNDLLRGGDDRDTLLGGSGNDTLEGGLSHDALSGAAGHDLMIGSSGNDTLHGADGADSLYGGTGNDILLGGDGDDAGSGQRGNDTIVTGAGADTISAEPGEIDEAFQFDAWWLQIN